MTMPLLTDCYTLDVEWQFSDRIDRTNETMITDTMNYILLNISGDYFVKAEILHDVENLTLYFMKRNYGISIKGEIEFNDE